MSGQAWALVGVVLGALLAGVFQLLHSTLQRRWARQDAEVDYRREREARLFDHRRETYLDFVRQFEHDEAATSAYVYDLPNSMPPDYDSYDALNVAAGRVGIFGSQDAYEAAKEAATAMLVYGMDGSLGANASDAVKETTRKQEQRLDEVMEAFRRAVRIDLGVDLASPSGREVQPSDEDADMTTKPPPSH